MRVAIFSWLLAACGGGGGQSGPVTSGPPAQLVAELPPGDVVVATVNGRPVHGSCVAAQAARQRGAEGRDKASRDQAVRECIDFELLAQAAEQRGLATHPDVVDATHQALARRLVDQWEATHTPDGMRKEIDALFAKGTDADRHLPERRRSYHALLSVPAKTGADVDARARAIAKAIHDQLANETGLFPAHLDEVAKRVPHDGFEESCKQNVVQLCLQPYDSVSADDPRTDKAYREALFAIPDVGRVSPVIKSQYGYHVILLTEVKPAEEITYAKAEPRLHELLQRKAFRAWVEELKKSHDVEGPYFDRLPQEAAP